MHILKAKKTFSWAYRNVDVREHVKGEIIETDDEDLVRVATEEGWVAPHKPAPGEKLEESTEQDPQP